MQSKTKICVISVLLIVFFTLIISISVASAYLSTLEKETVGGHQSCLNSDKTKELRGCQDSPEHSPDRKRFKSNEEDTQPLEGLENSDKSCISTQNEMGNTVGCMKSKQHQIEDGESADLKLYEASMVLSGVGDALGYHGGSWEFEKDGVRIYKELQELGGLDRLVLERPDWIVSDDTVMHLATARALVGFGNETDKEELYKLLAKEYIECMNDMNGRAPGMTCTESVNYLQARHTHKLPFNPRGGGCGAAMRAMCIGLRYPKEEELDDLIAVSIESGRLTHHHPTGYLGGLAAALFTSYALQRKPIKSWGKGLMDVLPKAKSYISQQNRDVKKNLDAWSYFEDKWEKYLKHRGIWDGESGPVFEENFDVKARDVFYSSLSFSGWGGSSGHDAPMIAYDALLGSNGSWTELCLRGMLHGGDNDSTGAIAGAWFGAVYGYEGVPKNHYEKLEYRYELEKLGADIFRLSTGKPAQRETSV